MTPTFLHSFDPLSASPVTSATVALDVANIEDAGIREVRQTLGATYCAWSILDALLALTGVGIEQRIGGARQQFHRNIRVAGMEGGQHRRQPRTGRAFQ